MRQGQRMALVAAIAAMPIVGGVAYRLLAPAPPASTPAMPATEAVDEFGIHAIGPGATTAWTFCWETIAYTVWVADPNTCLGDSHLLAGARCQFRYKMPPARMEVCMSGPDRPAPLHSVGIFDRDDLDGNGVKDGDGDIDLVDYAAWTCDPSGTELWVMCCRTAWQPTTGEIPCFRVVRSVE